MENKQNVTRAKLFFVSSDGSEMETGFEMPNDVWEKIHLSILKWQDEWLATTKTHLAYQKIAEEKREEMKEKLKAVVQKPVCNF